MRKILTATLIIGASLQANASPDCKEEGKSDAQSYQVILIAERPSSKVWEIGSVTCAE